MSLYEISFHAPSSNGLIVTATGSVYAQDGFDEPFGYVRGFSLDPFAELPDVSLAYAVVRRADVAGMYAAVTTGDGDRQTVLTPVTSVCSVSEYRRHQKCVYVRDDNVVALLTDPQFHEAGVVYKDVAARHGISEYEWDMITLSTFQAAVWKETIGFTASVYGEALIAASKQV